MAAAVVGRELARVGTSIWKTGRGMVGGERGGAGERRGGILDHGRAGSACGEVAAWRHSGRTVATGSMPPMECNSPSWSLEI